MAGYGKKTSKASPFAYIGVVILLIAILVLAYLVINASTNPGANLRKQQTFNIVNLSNSTVNRTKLILLSDLKKSLNLSSFSISYVSDNASRVVQGQGSFTLNIASVRTINSYHANNYSVTIYKNTTTYTDANTGELLSKNVSGIYYYSKANMQIECANHTTINTAGAENTTLDCGHGIQNNYYLLQFPYYAKNISKLGILVIEGNITYTGTKAIANRSCDNFVFSNITNANLLLNYSVVDLCLDSEYGIPLYIRGTNIIQRVPNKTIIWTMSQFATNASASDFIVPEQYLRATKTQ